MGYKSENKSQLVTIVKGGTVVEFYYAPDVYRVILNANGGTVEPTTVNVTYGSTYADLPVPTREGFEFVGWYNKLSGGIKVDGTVKVTTGYYSTLYARWTRVTSNDTEVNSSTSDVTTETPATTQSFFAKIVALISQIFGFIFSNIFGIG